MSTLSRPRDTTTQAWEFQLNCYRRMSGAERARIVMELNRAMSSVAQEGKRENELTMTASQKLLEKISTGLEAVDVPYMIVGSFASAYHGIPRSTQDLDIVVSLDSQSLDRMLSRLSEPDCYLSRDAAEQALKDQGQFNLIDSRTGWKVDFIICKDREFSRQELARRQRAELEGCEVFIATPEDTIISKLEWAKDSHSERQLRDVAGILDVHGDQLDHAYLQSWLKKLNLTAAFAKARGPW